MFSCREGELFEAHESEKIEQARAWFEENKNHLSITGRVSQQTVFISKTPEWNQAQVRCTSNGMDVVEIPLDYDHYVMYTKAGDVPETTQPNLVNSMLMFEVLPGHFEVYLLKIYPENPATVLTQEDFNVINYGGVPSTFSGLMMISDWNENFVGGWNIVDGERAGFRTRRSGSRTERSTSNGKIAATQDDWICYIVETIEWSIACIRGQGCGEPVEIGRTITIECEVVFAPNDPSSPGGGGGGYPGDDPNCFKPHPFIEGMMIPCSEQTITNSVTDPCIHLQVERAIASGITNNISTLVRDIFNVADEINLDVSQGNYLAITEDAETSHSTTAPGQINVQVVFNEITMPSRSQEYIMATLYHELLHAIWLSQGNTNDHHPDMATYYIQMLSGALLQHFPSLSPTEAIHLAWGGLQETEAWEGLSQTERNGIIATNDVHKGTTGGTRCI